ncbi:hypothetical protein [Rosistilla oblonga]|uniref:hypothetical protein n=1 Tax=Rosistilla oblonga TaxID=2527990 RepID=UPI003A9838F9
MLVQLHAQNPTDPKRSAFLMQGEVNSDQDAADWFTLCAAKWEELKTLRPDGWVPMVCTESYEGFMSAAEQHG